MLNEHGPEESTLLGFTIECSPASQRSVSQRPEVASGCEEPRDVPLGFQRCEDEVRDLKSRHFRSYGGIQCEDHEVKTGITM